MEEPLVTLKCAELAKEKGFNYPTNAYYWNDKTKICFMRYSSKSSNLHTQKLFNENETIYTISIPSQALLQKWLREVHNIKIFVNYELISSDDYEYCYKIIFEEGSAKKQCDRTKIIESLKFYSGGYTNTLKNNTYEETLEEGLQQTLKLIK